MERLVLVGSGIFEARSAASIAATRLGRLGVVERQELTALGARLADPVAMDENAPLVRLGRIMAACDTYDPLPLPDTTIEVQFDVHQRVWGQAGAFRAAGGLLAHARWVRCPVLAIHGSYDPQPAEGIREPLAGSIADFRFVLLDRCGHEPRAEREARGTCFAVLRAGLGGLVAGLPRLRSAKER